MNIVRKNIWFFGLIFLTTSLQCENAIQEQYHEWWQLSLGNSIPLGMFESWLGDVNSPSRVAMRRHVQAQQYISLLDVPCGLCIDFFGLQKDVSHVQYYGLDVTQKLVEKACDKGINVIKGDIENIPYQDNAFDIAYARHILEHLPYYKKALDELIRVASKEVLVVFFMRPTMKDDFIDYDRAGDYMVYHNHYNRQKLEHYILSNKKVKSIEWEIVNENEEIAHIYV